MSQTRVKELREQIFMLERRIKPLEWDSSRNQINEFKQHQLTRLKEEHSALQVELSELSKE